LPPSKNCLCRYKIYSHILRETLKNSCTMYGEKNTKRRTF